MNNQTASFDYSKGSRLFRRLIL